MENPYYYLTPDQQIKGPFELDDLLQQMKDGQLGKEVMVAKKGAPRWLPLERLTPEARYAAVGACPQCKAVIRLEDAELPLHCPDCGIELRRREDTWGSCLRSVFSKLLTFHGRATRAEYWWYILFLCIIGMVINFLLNSSSLWATVVTSDNAETMFIVYCVLSLVVYVAGTFLTLSVTMRRLHDVGVSGKWVILNAVFGLLTAILAQNFTPQLTSADSLQELIALFHEITSSPVFIYYSICWLISIIINFACFIWTLRDSQRGSNVYGPSPKYPQG